MRAAVTGPAGDRRLDHAGAFVAMRHRHPGRPARSGGVAGAVAWGRGECGGVVLAVHEGVLQGEAGGGHAVVLGEDQFLGAVRAVLGLVLAADDGEGVENLGDVCARDAVEVEEEGVQLGTDYLAAGFIPSERGAFVG